MRHRCLDVGLRGINAGDRRAQPFHRLADEPAAAPDIEQSQAVQRAFGLRCNPEMLLCLVTDEAQAHRVEFVKRPKLAAGIPPICSHR